MSSSRHHVLAISPAIKNNRVGDNRRTVITSMTPHISDQLGKTRVKHYYVDLSSKYEFWSAIICISINIVSDLSTTIWDGFDSLLVNESTWDIFYFCFFNTTGNNCYRRVKIKCKEYFSYHFPCWPVGVFRSNHMVFKFPLTMYTAGNRGDKTSETERILDSNVWSLYRRIF